MSADPLADLDTVPWENLLHAYGPAGDVPGQLRALTSLDPQVRGQAVWALNGNIVHQGWTSGASIAAVPFLVRLALSPDVPAATRAEIMQLLVLVAGSFAEDHLPFGFDLTDFENIADEVLTPAFSLAYREMEQLTTRDQDRTTAEQQLVLHTMRRLRALNHRTVARHAPALLGLLGDPNTFVRTPAIQLLGLLPDRAAVIVPALLRHLPGTVQEHERLMTLLALGWITHGQPDARVTAAVQAVEASTPRGQVARAIAQLSIDPTQPEAWTVLEVQRNNLQLELDLRPWLEFTLPQLVELTLQSRAAGTLN